MVMKQGTTGQEQDPVRRVKDVLDPCDNNSPSNLNDGLSKENDSSQTEEKAAISEVDDYSIASNGKNAIRAEDNNREVREIKMILDNQLLAVGSNAVNPELNYQRIINEKLKKLLNMAIDIRGECKEKFIPRNSVTFCLDGTPDEVLEDYIKLANHIRYWYSINGKRVNAKSALGEDKYVYTTPESGTLHIAVKYGASSVVFVVEARYGWLRGYYGRHAIFELKPDHGQKSYMAHPKSRTLSFKGNHHYISGGDPGETEIGLHVLRKLLQSAAEYTGNEAEPESLRRFIGAFTLYLCEGPKLDPIFAALCESLINNDISRLNKKAPWMTDLIRMWSSLSETIMKHIEFTDKGLAPPEIKFDGIPNLDTFEKLCAAVRILHLDAHPVPPFKDKASVHSKKKHKAHVSPIIWEPVDKGEGDSDVFSLPDFPMGNGNSNYTKYEAKNGITKKMKKLPFNGMVLQRGGRAGGMPVPLYCWMIGQCIRNLNTQRSLVTASSLGLDDGHVQVSDQKYARHDYLLKENMKSRCRGSNDDARNPDHVQGLFTHNQHALAISKRVVDDHGELGVVGILGSGYPNNSGNSNYTYYEVKLLMKKMRQRQYHGMVLQGARARMMDQKFNVFSIERSLAIPYSVGVDDTHGFLSYKKHVNRTENSRSISRKLIDGQKNSAQAALFLYTSQSKQKCLNLSDYVLKTSCRKKLISGPNVVLLRQSTSISHFNYDYVPKTTVRSGNSSWSSSARLKSAHITPLPCNFKKTKMQSLCKQDVPKSLVLKSEWTRRGFGFLLRILCNKPR